MHVKWICHILAQGIRTVETFSSTSSTKVQKVLLLIDLSQKKPQEVVSNNVAITVTKQKTISYIN